MKQGGKGRRTPSRAEVNAERRGRAGLMGSWLQERVALAQGRAKAARMRHGMPSGRGVTELMIAISREAARREPEWVVLHESPNRAMRRAGNRVMFRLNVPYVNPERDLKPGRRLRAELAVER